MSQVRLSGADRLRLVVAASIIRSKPSDVPVSSYVLDLYSKFPPSGPAPPTANYCWMTYALKLERDLQCLRENYEAQEIELQVARASGRTPDVIASSAPSILPTSMDNGSAKSSKKRTTAAKQNPVRDDVTTTTRQPPHLDPPNVPKDLHDQIGINFPPEGGLLFALHVIEKATSETGNDAILLHATLRALRVVARMLGSTLDCHPTIKTIGCVNTLGHVLHLVISSSLGSKVISQELDNVNRLELSSADKIFDCLIDDIFGPVIRAFKRISISSLSALLSDISLPTSDEAENLSRGLHSIDLRPALLRLFQMLIDSLRAALLVQDSSNRKGDRIHSVSTRCAISLSSLKASLILEVIRELRRTLFPATHEADSGDKSSDTQPEHGSQRHGGCTSFRVSRFMLPGASKLRDRMERLIAKDTLWYLCKLLHLLADLPIPGSLIELPSDVTPGSGSRCPTFPSLPEANVATNGDGTVLLGLLHETILSALYDLVLKCHPAVSQLQQRKDPSFHLDPSHKTLQPIEDKHRPFDTIRTHGFNPEGVLESQQKYNINIDNAGVPLAHGAMETERNSQAQGHFLAIPAQESEFGDPGGREQYTLPDHSDASVMAGGSHCHTDGQASVANQGRISEVITNGGTTLSKTQPELGVCSSGVVERVTDCVIDEAGFTMLLGCVERYILDPEYAY